MTRRAADRSRRRIVARTPVATSIAGCAAMAPMTRSAAAPRSPPAQYITKDIYIEVITDARGYTATQLEISLTPALSLLSQAGGSGQSNLSIRYRKDY